jgi:hypothetical protein
MTAPLPPRESCWDTPRRCQRSEPVLNGAPAEVWSGTRRTLAPYVLRPIALCAANIDRSLREVSEEVLALPKMNYGYYM